MLCLIRMKISLLLVADVVLEIQLCLYNSITIILSHFSPNLRVLSPRDQISWGLNLLWSMKCELEVEMLPGVDL